MVSSLDSNIIMKTIKISTKIESVTLFNKESKMITIIIINTDIILDLIKHIIF